MSGISALNVSKDSLLSHQTAINITGANIANVNTTGYSRQRPVFSTSGTIDVEAGLIQLSVEVDQIERVYDQFLENQINAQMHDFGYTESRQEQLERIEIIFNETSGEGIDDLLNKFWGAWEELSANPDGQAERIALGSVSQSMTYMFRSYANDLITLQSDVNEKISELVTRVNSNLSSIAGLNQKISESETGQGDTNVLRDKRSELIKEVAEIINVNYFEDATGAVNMFIADGTSLVEGQNVWQLDVQENAGNSFYYDIVLADNTAVSINSRITSGSLAGLLDIRDTTAAGYLSDLNTLAASLVQQTNQQHQLGYDMGHNLGGNFFDETKTEARDIAVDASIIADVNRIAASETVDGDGNNALYIGRLRDSLLMNGNTSTFNGYYASLIGQIGQDVASSERALEHHTDLMDQLTLKKESISGVSVDEEMVNLIKYQTGYHAAAKLCATVEELVDILLNLVE